MLTKRKAINDNKHNNKKQTGQPINTPIRNPYGQNQGLANQIRDRMQNMDKMKVLPTKTTSNIKTLYNKVVQINCTFNLLHG